MKRIAATLLVALLSSAALAGPSQHGKVEEHYPSGQVKTQARYKHGVLEGTFTRYHASGKVALKAKYKKGKLHGKYEERDAKGKPTLKATYKAGLLHGVARRYEGKTVVAEERWDQGRLLYPRSLRQVKAGLSEIAARKAGERSPNQHKALQRLNSYRFVVGLPADVTFDAEQAERAEAGAGLCKRIGRLDHTPSNPGMDEEAFAFAYSGTSSSNLYMGGDEFARSVDAYMDDSDPSNIDRVGHRRWCLSPVMQTTGFGGQGEFSAMWAFDKRRESVDYGFFAYPARGYQPVDLFAKNAAWSVSFNEQRFRIDRSKLTVKVYPLAGKATRPHKRQAPLPLDHFVADAPSMAGTQCVIFRPERAETSAGRRFWVEVEGVVSKDDPQPGPIGYLVEFVRL